MILQFIAASVVGIFFIYLCIKLANKISLRRLRKKYPEGAVNKSIPVTRLDEIPVSNHEDQTKIDLNAKDLLDQLK